MNTPLNSICFSQLSKVKSYKRSLLVMSILTLTTGATTNSLAQETKALSLEEVLVTAQRRQESLQSLPVSIAAVTGDDLTDKGITGFSELSQTVSGLQLERPNAAITSAIYVRGVGTAGLSSAGPSVGVAVDGVYLLRPGAIFNELMDIERVEVLRGPQGTLFGKNTTAGAINLITRDPETDAFSGSVQGVLGNLDNMEARGIINIPLIEDKLALRVAAFQAKRDGYTENVFIDEDTRNVDRWGYRAKLLWNVTDDFQAKLTAEKVDNLHNMDQANVDTGIGLGKYLQQHGQVSEDVDRYTLHLKWHIANHSLSTITAYDKTVPILINDFDESEAPLAILKNTSTTKAKTYEIQAASEFDGPFSYIVGYFQQEEELDSPTTINGTLVASTVREEESWAVFGTATYAFNDQWSTSIGVRYTEDDKEGTNVFFPNGTTETFEDTTYSAKLIYQLDEDTMLFASYATGFKSGGINNVTNVNEANRSTWDPETTESYELGMKSELMDNRLRLNATVFFQTYEDFLVSQSIPGEVRSVVSNAAEVESKGIETEFTFLASEILTINGSLTWVQSEYEDNPNQSCVVAMYPGCVLDPGLGYIRDLSGETLDHAPEFSGNLGAELRQGMSILDGAEWFARLDVIYRDEQNLEVWLPEEAEEGDYTLINTRFGLQGENWKLTGWINNLTDEEYRVSAFWTNNTLLGGAPNFHEIPNLERTYGVTMDWSF